MSFFHSWKRDGMWKETDQVLSTIYISRGQENKRSQEYSQEEERGGNILSSLFPPSTFGTAEGVAEIGEVQYFWYWSTGFYHY